MRRRHRADHAGARRNPVRGDEETNPRKIEEATEIMRAVGREICDCIDVGVDLDWSTERDPRYRDKRPMAQKMWATVMDVLVSIGALPLKDVA
jgi:hypothetical protein